MNAITLDVLLSNFLMFPHGMLTILCNLPLLAFVSTDDSKLKHTAEDRSDRAPLDSEILMLRHGRLEGSLGNRLVETEVVFSKKPHAYFWPYEVFFSPPAHFSLTVL